MRVIELSQVTGIALKILSVISVRFITYRKD